MSAIRFISQRFNDVRNMPRSMRTMRLIAGIGIAVAAAALVVALSIGRGFARDYKHALLDFNAHVIVMGIGEIDQSEPARKALEEFRGVPGEDAALLRHWGWARGAIAWARSIEERLTAWHRGIAAMLSEDGLAARAFRGLDPEGLRGIVPKAWREGARRLEAAAGRGVVAATPFLYREALAIGGGAIHGVVVKGMEPASFSQVNGMRILPFVPGTDLPEMLSARHGGPIPVVAGAALAEAMGVAGGPRKLRLLIPRAGEAHGGRRDFQEVLVVGQFESGIHDYDADFLLMRMEDLRRLFGVAGETVSGIEVKLDDAERAAAVASALGKRLGAAYRVITWEELNGDLISAVKLEQLVSSVIMGLMLFVAALNIIAALVLTTVHRLREISLVKALGLSDAGIERLLVASGMSVGGRGIAVGVAAGIALAWAIDRFHLVPLEAEIYLIGSLPIDISGVICGMLALFGGGLIWLTSRFAARKLSKINPAEGLAQAR